MKSVCRCVFGLGSMFAFLGLSGCSRSPERQQGKIPIEKTRPLPEIAASDKTFSSYRPAIPYEELQPNVLTRTIFDAAGPSGFRVEVRDLQVDAKKKGENIQLPGAAFLEVRGGSGVLTMADKRQDLPLGSTFSVPQGQSITLEATSDQPLTIRVRLVRAG